MNHHPQAQQGFTLIELMIVVAIVGILAAIAIPAYQDYTARAQMSEGLSLMDGAKTTVTEYWSNNGVFPTSNTAAGLPTNTTITGKYVAQVEVGTGGLITATMKASGTAAGIASKTIALSPTTSAGAVQWKCKRGGAPADAKYYPTNCSS